MLLGTVFSGLAQLAIEGVEDAGDVIVVRASTRGGAVECPECGTPTGRVHAFHERAPADVPVDGRRVLVRVRVRRMRCPVTGCPRQTFREQVPGLLERYGRCTVRLREQMRSVVRELAGRASARLLPALGIAAGRDTALRTLLGIALPERMVPIVLGLDDFALRRGRDYATVLIDADTGARIDAIPGRGAVAVADWLRAHPGARTVCRDGSTAYAQAGRDALPGAVQVADRWHLWHGLAEAVAKEVAAHSACWAGSTGLQEGPRARSTAERWAQVHGLLDNEPSPVRCRSYAGASTGRDGVVRSA
jgi:transposase